MAIDSKARLSEDPQVLHSPVSRTVLVYGSGVVSCAAALEVSKLGFDVRLIHPQRDLEGHGALIWGQEACPPEFEASMAVAAAEDSRIEITGPAKILDIAGAAGRFTVRLNQNGRLVSEEAGGVILALEPEPADPFDAWGLTPSKQVQSLSWIEKILTDDPSALEDVSTIVFLSGFKHPSNPFSQSRAVEAAIKLSEEHHRRIIFITEHFKVAQEGLEKLTRKAREKGILFAKLTHTAPEITFHKDRVRLIYDDEGIEEKVAVSPDLLLMEEAYAPSGESVSLGERWGISLHQMQPDTVYNRPVTTCRKGIWSVGPGKRPMSLAEAMDEARAAALEVYRFLESEADTLAQQRLLYDPDACGQCLTCYRSCPHGAISCSGEKPVFFEPSCRACGICAAGCPGNAIQIDRFTDDAIFSQITAALAKASDPSSGILAFCCENSAYEAARLARQRGLALFKAFHLIRVPCAGRIDLEYLLKAFESGAEGVMVLGCHDGSCKSNEGSRLAKRRVAMVRNMLNELGFSEAPLFFGTLAPGSSFEFFRMAELMMAKVKKMKAPDRKVLSSE